MARVTLRLPDEVHKRLVALARESGTSMNETIVDILSTALGCERIVPAEETPREAERRRIREALGDLVVEFTPEELAPFMKHPLSGIDREALFRSLAGLDPPLSATIIQEREESGY